MLVTQESLREMAPAGMLLFVDRGLGGPSKQEAAESLEEFAGPRNLAYVLDTSGSTGKPKGVQMNTRRRQLPDLDAARAGLTAERCPARGHDAFLRHRRTGNLPPADHRRKARAASVGDRSRWSETGGSAAPLGIHRHAGHARHLAPVAGIRQRTSRV